MNRPFGPFFLALFVAMVVSTLGAQPAGAQGDAPTRIGVLLTDKDDSEDVRDALIEALRTRDGVELIPSYKVLAVSDARGIERTDYLKGSRREALVDDFAEVLQESKTDGLFLLDMISGGDRVQLVVIGPDGDERADIREPVDEVLDSDTSLDELLIGPGLSALPSSSGDEDTDEPGLAKMKGDDLDTGSDEASGDAEAATQETTTATASADASAGVTLDRSARSKSSFQITGGAFFGRRSFDASSNLDYKITNVVPLVGARLAAQVRLVQWSQDASQIWFAAQGAWAPYSVEFRANGASYNEDGHHIGGRAEILYRQALTASLSARATAGADIVSDTIDSNPVFTGSRYMNGRVTVGVGIHPVDVFELTLAGGVLPVISAETSGQSYGDSSASLGYAAVAELNMALSERVLLTTGYDLRTYQTSFPDPQVIDGTIDTTELFHGASFGITYGL